MVNIDVKGFAEKNLGKEVRFDDSVENTGVSKGVVVGYNEPGHYVIISIESNWGWDDDNACEDDRILIEVEDGKACWYMFPEDLEIID